MKTPLKQLLPKPLKRNIMKILILPHWVINRIWFHKRIYLRWTSSDVNVYYHTFVEKEFFIPLKIQNSQTIIDAGANIGLTALLFHQEYPLSKIIAIEPEISNYKLLVKNTKEISNIIPLQKGLWSSSKHLRIENPENEKWAFRTKEVFDGEGYDIDGINVSSLIEKYQLVTIDILKIDIEGAEKEIFSKHEDEWLPKVKWIVIEIHGNECRTICERALLQYSFKHVYTNGENEYYANTRLVENL